MAPKALGRRKQAQADKEATVLIEGVGTICAEADDGELEYVTNRLKNNKNLLQRFRPKCSAPFNAILFMIHPSLVRLACMPPPRLSSLLKKDTLVALLDGTADSAQSQPVAAENVAQLPVSLKKFKRLSQQPKLVDKILAAMDPHKFTPDVLGDKLWKDGAKLGVVYMYLKQSPESDMPRMYILELKFEAVFFRRQAS